MGRIRSAALLLVCIMLSATGCGTAASDADGPVDVFVQIPESIWPIARGEKYEDPLDAALRAADLGEVTGGGSQIGAPSSDGEPTIEWVGIDVSLTELERGLPFLKRELQKLGAPAGTEILYFEGETPMTESL